MDRGMRCLAVVLLIVMVASTCLAAGQARWVTHKDAAGFAVATPEGWTVTRDAQSGRINLRGPQGETSVLWPVLLEQRNLDARGAQTIALQLARKIDPQLTWVNPELAGTAVRVAARTAQRKAVTVVTWSSGQKGTGLQVYFASAPAGIYRSSIDTFTGIWSSFRAVPVTAPSSSAPHSSGPLTFTSWRDPRENAFTVSVPQGWHVVGGMYRLSATDTRSVVNAMSPDGRLSLAYGDANIGVFSEMTPMATRFGMRPGSVQTLGDGTRVTYRNYVTGRQFVREYVERNARSLCGGLQITGERERPDLVPVYQQEARSKGLANARVTAGEVSFTCTSTEGPPQSGQYAAVTILAAPGQVPLWFVHRLFGYVAASDRRAEADGAVQRLAQSYSENPQWTQQQRQISQQAVAQDNRRSQEIQQRALKAIREDQQATTDMIIKGHEARSHVYDEISRKRENAILGTVDVVDPNSGRQYKISYNSDYNWMSDTGYMGSTKTADAPGPGWHQMIDLP